MKISVQCLALLFLISAFSGCITSQYKNDKGCDCTRRYFPPFGISVKTCSDTPSEVTQPATVEGKELNVAPLASSPSLRESTPAKTIAQNIKSTTQALR